MPKVVMTITMQKNADCITSVKNAVYSAKRANYTNSTSAFKDKSTKMLMIMTALKNVNYKNSAKNDNCIKSVKKSEPN